MTGALGASQYQPLAVINSELPGLYINAYCLADPSGSLLTLTGSGQVPVALTPSSPTIVSTFATGSQSPSNTGSSFDTSTSSCIAVDVTVTSLNGGVLPNITFFVQRLGASSVWYTIWSNTTPIGGAAVVSASIGPSLSGGTASSGNGGFSAVLSGTCRFGWSTGGTSAPTSWTGSAQVVTR